MKKPRIHVSIREETLPNKKTAHIVTWTPSPRNRQRKSFMVRKEADAFADEIEKTLTQGHDALSTIPRWRQVAINALAEMLPQAERGAMIHRAFQFYLDHHGLSADTPATAEEVGLGFIASRSTNFSERHRVTIESHVKKFIRVFGSRPYSSLNHSDYTDYLTQSVGGAGKSQNNHLITLKSMARWARDIGNGITKYLPPGPTAVDHVQRAQVADAEHTVYQPEQFMRLLVATPLDMIVFMVLGQFAGIRAAERCRLKWQHWRQAEDNKLVLNPDVTKTKRRRRVDVESNLITWLSPFRGEPEEMMVLCNPYKRTLQIAKNADVPWIDNALRSGYASYHLELFGDAAKTAQNCGHSVTELETTYRTISGVTKKIATEMFAITPQSVLAFAKSKKLPEPEWAGKIS